MPAIESLETEGLNVEEQCKVINFVQNQIVNDTIKIKFEFLLLKNEDLIFFMDYCYVKCSKENKELYYVPLTNAAVERSFSALNYLYSDKRRCLGVEMLGVLLFLYYNK